jgi:polysaccharide biosynthesis transport protein
MQEPPAELESDQRAFDPLAVLTRHKLLIALSCVIGLGLGFLHYTRQPRVYESVATLLVVDDNKQATLPIQGLESVWAKNENLAKQMYLIRSPLVLDRAARDERIATIPSLANSPNVAATIAEGLSLAQARANNDNLAPDILELRFRGPTPEDCADTLMLVIKAYEVHLSDNSKSKSAETLSLITKAKDVLLSALQEKERAFREHREKSDLIWDGDVGTNIHQQRLRDIEQARGELLIKETELNSQIVALEAAQEQGLPREALIQLAGHLTSSQVRNSLVGSTPRDLATQITELEVEEQIARGKFGARHPKLQALQSRLLILRELAAAAEEPGVPGEGSQDLFRQYLDSLRQEYAVLMRQKQDLDALFDKEWAEARELNKTVTESATMMADINRTQQLFDSIVKRLDEISLLQDVGGAYMQVVNHPAPGLQVLPRFTSTLLMGTLLGLAAGFGLASVLELTNRDFRGLDDLSRQLRVPVVGQYPEQRRTPPPVAGSRLHSSLVAYHRPKSRLAEAYRGVRTALYFSQQNGEQPHRVLQVTSPVAGDGAGHLREDHADQQPGHHHCPVRQECAGDRGRPAAAPGGNDVRSQVGIRPGRCAQRGQRSDGLHPDDGSAQPVGAARRNPAVQSVGTAEHATVPANAGSAAGQV